MGEHFPSGRTAQRCKAQATGLVAIEQRLNDAVAQAAFRVIKHDWSRVSERDFFGDLTADRTGHAALQISPSKAMPVADIIVRCMFKRVQRKRAHCPAQNLVSEEKRA